MIHYKVRKAKRRLYTGKIYICLKTKLRYKEVEKLRAFDQ